MSKETGFLISVCCLETVTLARNDYQRGLHTVAVSPTSQWTNLFQKALDSVLQVGDISTIQVVVLKASRTAGVDRATASK